MYGAQISFWDSTPTPDADGADASDEEVVVLVHGMAGSARTWSPLLGELARRRDRRRFIAPDLLGHGTSTAPWADYSLGGYATGIRDLLAALGHTRATLVGHSLGGGIAAQFAFQFPQQCDRLVLVDSGGLGRDVGAVLRAATWPGAEWVLPLITLPALVGAGRWVERLAGQVPGLSAVIRRGDRASMWEAADSFASLADPAHRRAFLHTVRGVIDAGGQRVQALERLHLVEGLPTLIAWGTADTMIPLEHGRRAHELIKGSELALFEGAGHFPHCDQPARFAEILVEFLDRTHPAHLGPEHLARRIAHDTELSADRHLAHPENASRDL